MKLITSLLLGSAASMFAVAGASAADLPSRSKGPSVEYVKVCDTYGAGYFYIPGGDTCLKISGYARADYAVRNVNNRWSGLGGNLAAALPGASQKSRDSIGFGGLGGLELDARSQTSWGTLRGFIRYEINTGSGLLANPFATLNTAGGTAALDKAYVQFAGITAGRAQSFFDFYGDAYPLDNSRGSDSTTHMLAYTASFGGGFSATVSIEDPTVRRGGVGSVATFAPAPVFAAVPAAFGGSKIPDVVANLRVAQGWGTAQLSGAIHQNNTLNSALVGATSASKTGWAVQAGIAINLPSLAAGDEIYLQGAYAVGAKSYLGLGALGSATNGVQRIEVDAVSVPVGPLGTNNYRLELGRGYNVQAGLKHFWAPNLKQYIYASYTTWNYGATARAPLWNAGGFGNGKELEIGTGIVWTPVKNLDLTFDLEYARLTQNVNTNALNPLLGSAIAPLAIPINTVAIKKDGSSFTGRLRIQRAF